MFDRATGFLIFPRIFAFSFFKKKNYLTAIILLVTSCLKQLVCLVVACSHAIEVTLSYDGVSLLLIAVFGNERVFFNGAET